MLLDRDLHGLNHLVLALLDHLLDALNDLLDDIAASLDLDFIAVGILLGELDGASQLPAIVGTASTDNDIAQRRAYFP